jgi:hypothetical protein
VNLQLQSDLPGDGRITMPPGPSTLGNDHKADGVRAPNSPIPRRTFFASLMAIAAPPARPEMPKPGDMLYVRGSDGITHRYWMRGIKADGYAVGVGLQHPDFAACVIGPDAIYIRQAADAEDPWPIKWTVSYPARLHEAERSHHGTSSPDCR